MEAARRATLLAAAEKAQLPVVAALMVIALGAWWIGHPPVVDSALIAATVIALVPATWHSVVQLVRRDATADVVAVLAMAGALALGEWLAGAIIALMLTGGEALEARAVGRARSELTSLLGRAPRIAHVRVDSNAVVASSAAALAGDEPDGGSSIIDVAIDDVGPGDVVVVKVGEVVPVDGMLLSSRAVLDEQALTGESVPVEITAGQAVRSGVVNAGGPLELRATASAEASTYAGVVRLVEQAATERAPFVRVADRFAGWFLVVTLVLAAGAWLASGDPVRALAVLVVATPCPLILAAPAAIIGGVSAAARRGIIVKGGSALEALAGGQIVLLDKTGTVTTGRPRVAGVDPVGDHDTAAVLRLAAAVDQMSVHPFAPAIVEAAHARAADDAPLVLPVPTDVHEEVGQGIWGTVEGQQVRVGQLAFSAGDAEVPAAIVRAQRRAEVEGRSLVYVAVDGALIGTIALHDPVRADTPRSIDALRRAGITQIGMVTGDRQEIAELVGDAIGIDELWAERSPDDKVDVVRQARQRGLTIMVGDGINDAPALALADSGVAMGARGATAASEAADVVLTSDRLDGLAQAVTIARRTRRIAWQSAVVGIGLSAVAMVFAALGYLTPVAGAIVQEVIDLAVLANALRALRPADRSRRMAPVDLGVVRHQQSEHRMVANELDRIAHTAERLEHADAAEQQSLIDEVRALLVDGIVPHELDEEAEVYPIFAQALHGQDPTLPLVRAHRELSRRVRLLDRMVEQLRRDTSPGSPLTADDIVDLQRALFGVHALLELHLRLEDELYAVVEAAHRGSSAEPRL